MDNPGSIAQQLQSNNLLEIHNALMIIRDQYMKHFDKMMELEKYSVIQMIVSFLEHPNLINISLTIIDNVCHEKIWAFKVIKCNGIKFLTQIMKNLPGNDIQHQACKIVANIANYEVDFKAFQTIELVTNIIQFLLATDKIAFKQTALQTLCILGKDTKCRDLIVHENGIFHIIKLLNSPNKDIILYCIQALAELTENCNIDCVRQILGIKFSQILVDLYNQCESNIKAHILKSLKNLTALEMVRSDLTKAGAVKLFAEVATDYKSFYNAKLALLGLCNCLGYIHMWANYGTSRLNGLKILVEALRHRDFKDIHDYIIVALLPLTFEQGLAYALIDLGLICILMQFLKSFNEQHKFDHKNSLFHESCSFTENLNSSSPQRKIPFHYGDVVHKDHYKQNDISNNNVDNTYVEYFSRTHFLNNYNFPPYSSGVNNHRSPSDKSVDSLFSNFSWPHSWCSYTDSQGKCLSSPELSPSGDNIEYGVSNFPISVKNSVPDYKELPFSSVEIPKTTVSAEKDNIAFMNLFSAGNNNNEHNKCSIKHANISSNKLKLLNECRKEHLSVNQHKRYITKMCVRSEQFQNEDTNKRIKVTECPGQKLKRIEYFSLHSPVNQNAKMQTIDNYILSLLTQLSFHLQKKCNSDLASSSCFSILMQYIFCVQNANPKAEKLLLILVKNRYCFEKLIMSGFVSEMEDIFKIIHDPNICIHCSRVSSIYKNLNAAVRKEAESEYGIGTLCHILCTSEKVCQFHALYTISKLIGSKQALYKTLIQANGLSILLSLLDDFSSNIWKQAILCLCEVYQNLKKISCKKSKDVCCISQTCGLKLTSKCLYKDDIFDVIFVIEGGIQIGASREKICKNSEYFRALLKGHFQEANKDVITIDGLSAETLLTIFHFLHGCCTTEYCPYIKEISFEILLEVFSECDKFLLFDIKSFIQDRLCHNLYPSTVLKIYQKAKMYNSTPLHYKAIEYVLSLDTSQKEILLQCFQEFLKLGSNLQLLNDIKKMVETILID